MGDTVAVPLSKGYVAIVDAVDAPRVLAHKWSAQVGRHTVYAIRRVRDSAGRRRKVWLHRFIVGAPADVLVDHRDRDGLNNQRGNLRTATRSQNGANATRRVDNSSGYKGVVFRPERGCWKAQIYVDGRKRHLGSYACATAAGIAYLKAARQHFGAFAY